jgi:hypothetical protein
VQKKYLLVEACLCWFRARSVFFGAAILKWLGLEIVRAARTAAAWAAFLEMAAQKIDGRNGYNAESDE